jgi:Mrp family chromosome partitioning ATPase
MTRLFDALRKTRLAASPVPPEPVPLSPPPRPAAAPATRPSSGLPSVPNELARRSIVPLGGGTSLPPDVAREMVGLRVRLEAMLTEQIPRTVMFLASQGGEGTSTVVHQFARALAADSRLRILVVDTHSRRPAYAADGRWLVEGAGRLDRAVNDGTAGTKSLDLMPVLEAVATAGGAAPQVLMSILQTVAGGYDWILLDGPPVLESPDAAPLGQAVDGVVVVAQAGRTKRPVLMRTVDLVTRSGGRVIGIVLNRRRLEIPEFVYRRI